VPDGATLGTSTAVSTDDCTRSYADALQDAKTLIMAWLTECKAPGAVTLAVDECFEPLLEVKVETNSRVLDSLWTAGVGSQEFADALEVASDADLEYVTKGLPMSHERTCAIDEEIAARTVKKKTTEPTPTGKLSKEARAQIIAAQKARWAKVKATKKKK
jgi:hypothetical protein